MRGLVVCAWMAGIILVLFVLLLLAAPAKVHIERSREIRAPAPVVWEHIVKLEKFGAWSNWWKNDPAAAFRRDGVNGAARASSSWKGQKLGEGKLELVFLLPYSEVRQRLSLYEPFEYSYDIRYRLAEKDSITLVTWAMDASYSRPQNVLGLFMKSSMERDLAQGLENLQSIAETDVAGRKR